MKKRPHITIQPKREDERTSIRVKPKPAPSSSGGFSWKFFTKRPDWLPKWALERSFLLAAGGVLFVMVLFIILSQRNQETYYEEEILPMVAIDTIEKFEISIDSFDFNRTLIKADESLGEFLLRQKIEPEVVEELVAQAGVHGIREMKQGEDIFIYFSRGASPGSAPDYIIYQPNPSLQVYFYMNPAPMVKLEQEALVTKIESAAVLIKDNFFNAVVDNGLPRQIIPLVEKALQWSVDLYHIDIGDEFRIVYEGQYAGEQLVGIGRLLAVSFYTKNKIHYAYNSGRLDTALYYDDYGKSMVRTYLKSPVKYGYISSKYNKERLHPVLKEKRPHYGTDYAAPLGTPIFAVSDGKIIKAEVKGGNGLYVKIKHDQKIETQYLHMSALQQGIRPNVLVRQGEVIGYVGESGLASGPHVCFRFWKNGQQVDHLKENLDAPAAPLSMQEEDKFYSLRDSLKPLLERAAYRDMQ